jgi:hypothetical protein
MLVNIFEKGKSSIINGAFCMQMINGLLREVNTIMSGVCLRAMELCERFGGRRRMRGTGKTAKDVMLGCHTILHLVLKGGVVAFIATTHFLVVGFKDTVSPIAHGVNNMPLSIRIRGLRMDVHRPMFMLRAWLRNMKGDMIWGRIGPSV